MNSRRNVHLKGTVTLVFFEPLGAPVPKCWHAILKGVKRPTRVDFRFRGQGFTFRSNKKTAKNRHLIHVEDPDSSSDFGCPSFPQLFNMYIYIYRTISNTWFLWFWWWSHDGIQTCQVGGGFEPKTWVMSLVFCEKKGLFDLEKIHQFLHESNQSLILNWLYCQMISMSFLYVFPQKMPMAVHPAAL